MGRRWCSAPSPRSPWRRPGCALDDRLFVHAGWHPGMLTRPPPPDAGARKPDPLLSRAMFGQVTGRMQPDGYPERLDDWVDRIPRGHGGLLRP